MLTAVRDNEDHRALHGLARALLANAVTGVTSGFKKSWTSSVSDTAPNSKQGRFLRPEQVASDLVRHSRGHSDFH
jgi:hypothetical protein